MHLHVASLRLTVHHYAGLCIAAASDCTLAFAITLDEKGESVKMAPMTKRDISSGVVHEVPADLCEALTSDPEALAAWEDLTPLARNEWICWTISVKKPETRREHVERVRTELKEGMRRPCCWLGCIHRTDKAVSPSVQYVLNKGSKKP